MLRLQRLHACEYLFHKDIGDAIYKLTLEIEVKGRIPTWPRARCV